MIAASPLTLASHNGVEPSRFAALAFAPALNQQVHHFFIGSEHRPVKRGRAVGLRRIHIGMLVDQLLHGQLIAVHHRVRNIRGHGAETGNRQQRGNSWHNSKRRASCRPLQILELARAVADAVLMNVVHVEQAQ